MKTQKENQVGESADESSKVGAATVICAWCGATVQHGTEVITHGICAPCRNRYFTAWFNVFVQEREHPERGLFPVGGIRAANKDEAKRLFIERHGDHIHAGYDLVLQELAEI